MCEHSSCGRASIADALGNYCNFYQHIRAHVGCINLSRAFFKCEGGANGGEGGGAAGGSSLQNLHAIVAGVSHDDAPVAVDGDAATREAELSVV